MVPCDIILYELKVKIQIKETIHIIPGTKNYIFKDKKLQSVFSGSPKIQAHILANITNAAAKHNAIKNKNKIQ